MKQSREKSAEHERFDEAMDAILKVPGSTVKEAIEAEQREREEQARRTGKRGRGRPPKVAPSGHASS